MSARKKSANNVQFAKKSLAPPRGISKHAPADGLINANTPWNHIPEPEQSAVLLATPILVYIVDAFDIEFSQKRIFKRSD